MFPDSLALTFIVEDKPANLSEVIVGGSCSIDQLKATIEKKLCLGVPTSHITLWKLTTLIYPLLDTSAQRKDFADKIKDMQLDPDLDDPPGAVQLRYVSRKVSAEWENKPPPDCLHIIVRVLPFRLKRQSILSEDEGRERKRTRETTDAALENLRKLHRLFWGVSDSSLFVTNRVAIPDARSLKAGEVKEFVTVNLPDTIQFPDGSSTMIITEIFKTFRQLLLRDDAAWEQIHVRKANQAFSYQSHCSVIAGQPGIGKTVFLNDTLVHRLQAKLVTIYCNDERVAYVFSDDGVRKIRLDWEDRIPELDADPHSCALVNLGAMLLQPPTQFYPRTRLGRVVIAASPNPAHVACFKECPTLTYYMPTWDWSDLYCGSLVYVGKVPSDGQCIKVEREHDELLREAYWKFAGIPRICYKIFSDKSMAEHHLSIDIALANIKSIDDFAHLEGLLAFKSEASHSLVKTEPIPDTDWKHFRTDLKSPYISELVFQHVHRSIRLSEDISRLLLIPAYRGHARSLFKPAAHRTLEMGKKVRPIALNPDAPSLILEIHKPNPSIIRRFYSLSVQAGPGSRDADKKYFNQYLLPMLIQSVDSVVITKHFTTLLQMTVSTSHGIKLDGILCILDDLPANAKKNLRIVFMLPSEDEETRLFKCQKIIAPQGASAEDVALVASIPQYVYRLPLK